MLVLRRHFGKPVSHIQVRIRVQVQVRAILYICKHSFEAFSCVRPPHKQPSELAPEELTGIIEEVKGGSQESAVARERGNGAALKERTSAIRSEMNRDDNKRHKKMEKQKSSNGKSSRGAKASSVPLKATTLALTLSLLVVLSLWPVTWYIIPPLPGSKPAVNYFVK